MSRVILPAVLTATFVFLLAPIVVVVLASFNGVGVLSFPPRAFTTRWYYEIDPSFYRALWVSLLVGVITVVLAVLVECRVRSGWRGGVSVAATRSTRSACPR